MADSAIPGDDPSKAAVEAAIARAKARKQEQQAGSEPAEPVDPRKAAVEAAIARAKARKQEQQTGSEPAEPIDPRKAAVEAAIARAKSPQAGAADRKRTCRTDRSAQSRSGSGHRSRQSP
ncbi:hypothetical protein SEEC0006_27463 [Salmonella enterica subsp. enterica serovar Choleraesuis str. 0006]|nr:hypothetical protein SEEC0006_27463 [Salmonella enterica subsp. enterica serovar Choleraesuis str. 0006]